MSQENYVASGVLVDCRIILLVLFVICVSLQIQSEKCEGNTAGLLVVDDNSFMLATYWKSQCQSQSLVVQVNN